MVAGLSHQYGGVSTSVRELCGGLSLAGVTVGIATTWRGYNAAVDGPADEALRKPGVQLFSYPTTPTLLGSRYAFSPQLKNFLDHSIGRYDAVHIHALWQYPAFAASRACLQSRIPYVVSPCGLLDEYGLRRRALFKRVYGSLVERRTLGQAACIHFTSDLEKQHAFLFGTNPPQAVIPRSIRMEEIPEGLKGKFRASFPEIGNRSILLFFGRLHPKKRLDIVVDAFVSIAPRMKNVHLVIVGQDDGAGEQARRTLRKSGLLERTSFTGSLSGQKKWSAFQDADLFLLPSEGDSFGMAALEAMACGVPMLISDQVGLANAVLEAGAGLVLPGRDPSAWIQALEQLLGDAPLRKKMGERGQQLASSRFTTHRVAEAMKYLYTSCLLR